MIIFKYVYTCMLVYKYVGSFGSLRDSMNKCLDLHARMRSGRLHPRCEVIPVQTSTKRRGQFAGVGVEIGMPGGLSEGC